MNRIAGGALVPYNNMIGNISNILTDINTLEGALMFFNLDSHLTLLDSSLVDLRLHMQSKEAHEETLKNFDKRLRNLSLKYHPDKVTNRGGSNEEIAIAYNLQITLNAIRKIFVVLNETFLENIKMYTRFSHYAKLNISSLSKECDIKNRVYELLFKASSVSEIRTKKVVAEIRQFLIESEACITHFLGNNISEFKECRNLAVVHLENCIKGYDNLIAEVTNVVKKCRDENIDFIHDSAERISEIARNISHLKAIKNVAEISFFKTYEFFSTAAPLDKYYVSPFASYINVMGMCSAMLENKSRSILNKIWYTLYKLNDPVCNEATSSLLDLHSLTQYYCGHNGETSVIKRMLNQMNQPFTEEGIWILFRYELSRVKSYLEDKFRVSNYHVENIERYDVMEEHRKCIRMLSEFKAREEELKNEIKRLSCRNQDLEEEYDRAVKQIEEFYVQDEKRTEQIKVTRTKKSSAFKKSYIQTL